MKNIWTIMKKELSRVFTDKKLIISVFILPGLIIFSIYSIMGSALSNMFVPDDIIVYEEGMPSEIKNTLNSNEIPFNITYLSDDGLLDIELINEQIIEEQLDFAIYFKEEKISYLFNSVNMSSTQAKNLFLSIINSYDQNIVIIGDTSYSFDVSNNEELEDLASTEDKDQAVSMQVTSILPMLIMIFLFQGALSFGPESIAGDKERGTIATLLATPTKRSEIALGKILSLAILAILASLSSFIGIILSLPKLMGGAAGDSSISLTYGISDYLQILTLLIVSVLVIIGVVSIISAYAKNVKEATSYSAPFMILTMIIGLSNMFMSTDPTIGMFFIPIYNVVQMLNLILASKFNITFFIITIITNISLATLLSYILTKLFQNEKVMFAK